MLIISSRNNLFNAAFFCKLVTLRQILYLILKENKYAFFFESIDFGINLGKSFWRKINFMQEYCFNLKTA